MVKVMNITTEDGKIVHLGDRVYNYYDCKWGIITRIFDRPQPNLKKGQNSSTPMENWDDYWFIVTHDDGTSADLNGSRIATYDPKGSK